MMSNEKTHAQRSIAVCEIGTGSCMDGCAWMDEKNWHGLRAWCGNSYKHGEDSRHCHHEQEHSLDTPLQSISVDTQKKQDCSGESGCMDGSAHG